MLFSSAPLAYALFAAPSAACAAACPSCPPEPSGAADLACSTRFRTKVACGPEASAQRERARSNEAAAGDREGSGGEGARSFAFRGVEGVGFGVSVHLVRRHAGLC